MKKFLFFMVFMLFATVAQAERTPWIKGGLSFFDGEKFCTDNNPSFDQNIQNRCGDNFDGKSFFIQASPVNLRGKFDGSKLGYRLEPWIGYSQTGNTDSEGGQEDEGFVNGVLDSYNQTKFTNLNIKNFQIGTNLFLDFEIMPDVTVYGGPVVFYQFSKLTAEVTHYGYDSNASGGFDETLDDGHYSTSEWDSDYGYGANLGLEFKITKTLALNTFAGVLKHGSMYDEVSESQWDQDTEIRAGLGVTAFW